MGTEDPTQRREPQEAEPRDELPIPDLDVEVGEESSETIRGGADDLEANSEKVGRRSP